MIIISLTLVVFWIILMRLNHPTPEKSKTYRLNQLSKFERLKIKMHIDMCMECQILFENMKQMENKKLPLEDHLVDPKE